MTTLTTKTQRYTGNRYDITVIHDPANGYFEIVATHKESKRKSSVTNLNFILSEFFEQIFDWDEVISMEDSWLRVKNKRKFKKLVAKARIYFQQIDNDLEKALDDDMEQGGWNSEEAE